MLPYKDTMLKLLVDESFRETLLQFRLDADAIRGESAADEESGICLCMRAAYNVLTTCYALQRLLSCRPRTALNSCRLL